MSEPAYTYTERLPEKTKDGKRHKTRGHRWYWCPCDVCGEELLVALTASESRACKLTPRCPGSHRRPT